MTTTKNGLDAVARFGAIPRLQGRPAFLTFGTEATGRKIHVADPLGVERTDLSARSLVTGAAASES
ncbi:MAG: hypothetical protein AB1679_34760 [Actinomycetota bacterium]|jgi:hypothetical protein